VRARPNALVVLVQTNPDASAHGLFEEHERAGDVCLDERLTRVGPDVGLVERGGMQHRVNPFERAAHHVPVGHRPHDVYEWSELDVQPARAMAVLGEQTHERLPKVAVASGHENVHAHTMNHP
jgi:hypothetical protein